MPEAPPVTIALAPLMSMGGSLERGRGLEVGDPFGGEDGRSGQQDAVVLGPDDLQGAAGEVDLVRRSALGAVGRRRGHHHRTGTGAAGPGLPRTTLVHAHGDVSLATSYDELDVDALGIGGLVVARS